MRSYNEEIIAKAITIKKKDKEFLEKYNDSNILIRFTAKELYYLNRGILTGEIKGFFTRTWIKLRKKGELEEQSTT